MDRPMAMPGGSSTGSMEHSVASTHERVPGSQDWVPPRVWGQKYPVWHICAAR